MQQSSRELWLSFIAIIFITLLYLFVVIMFGAIPGASDLFGHSIGIIGFILMLMTETLYTLRKRSRSAKWGRMSSWLQFHIFTGLVGPYMVLTAYILEVQWTGGDGDAADDHHRCQRFFGQIYLHGSSEKCRWDRN